MRIAAGAQCERELHVFVGKMVLVAEIGRFGRHSGFMRMGSKTQDLFRAEIWREVSHEGVEKARAEGRQNGWDEAFLV